MTRGKYEFSDRTKEAARRKWHAENPGNEDANLEVDHLVAVWFAKKHGIPHQQITSGANAKALRQKEHKAKHRNEPTEEEYKTLAQGLLGIIKRLF